MKTIKELMKSPAVAVEENETINNVAGRMYESNIGFVPVVDENQKVIGALTDRDIALAVGRTKKTAGELKVRDIMSTKVHTIQVEDNAIKALNIMRTKQVGRLPVVDSENKLKGVISLNGMARKIGSGTERKEKAELEYEGAENIVNTIHSLAERNRKREPISENAEGLHTD